MSTTPGREFERTEADQFWLDNPSALREYHRMLCVTLRRPTDTMINWFRKEHYTEYKDRLLKAFPQTLKSDVEVVLNILPFDVKDVMLTGGSIHKVDNLIHESILTVQLDNEQLVIPYRLYFNEPDIEKENKLTDIQKTILNCIYLRHHDGFLRQRRLEKLLDKNENWVVPFKFQLLGEYVFEIVRVLDKHIIANTIDNYGRFVEENPKYWQQTESRMISYWNVYYRRQFPKLKDYLGRQIVDRIKKRTHNSTLPKAGQTLVKGTLEH